MTKIFPFRSLDAFRGLAALWVVMTHACLPYITGTGHAGDYLNNPLYAFSAYGQLGVVLFFVISGYCIAGAAYGSIRADKRPRRFFFERVRRIYPPYLAACLLALVSAMLMTLAVKLHLVQVGHFKNLSSFSFAYWLANLSITQVELGQESLVIVFWTLSYEVAFYALVFLFLQIADLAARRSGGRWTWVTCLLNITTFVSLGHTLMPHGMSLFPLDLWWQFGLGALLFQLRAAQIPSAKKASAALFVACLLAIGLLAVSTPNNGSLGHPSTKWQAIACIGFGLLLAGLQSRERRLASTKICKGLVTLGTFSYSLYLIHTLVQPFVDVGMRRVGLIGELYVINFFAQIVVSVIAGWLFFLAVEKHFMGKRVQHDPKTEQLTPHFEAASHSPDRLCA